MPRPQAFLFNILLLTMVTCLLSGPAWGASDRYPGLDELERGAGVKLHHSRHPRTGAVRSLWAEPGQTIPPRTFSPGTSPEEAAAMMPEMAAMNFLGRYGTLFGIKDSARELAVKRIKTADRGRTFVRFQQLHKGVPVIGGEMVVQLDAANGVMSAHGKTSPDAALDTTPAVGAAEGKETALKTVAAQTGPIPPCLRPPNPSCPCMIRACSITGKDSPGCWSGAWR